MCFGASLVLVAFYGLVPAKAQEIWYAPPDDYPRGDGRILAPDYMDLFRHPGTWSRAAKHVSTFVLSEELAGAGPASELKTIFSFLAAHGIKLALGVGMVARTRPCSEGTEGIEHPGEPLRIATRIAKLGGHLDSLVMDEPLFFAHEYSIPGTCRFSVEEVARNVAQNVQAVRSVFPRIQIGDVEPIMSFSQAWQGTLTDWVTAYQTETGSKLDFLMLDIDWRTNWAARVRPLKSLLTPKHIPLGIMFDANEPQPSDTAWIKTAQDHIRAFEREAGTPDQAVFVSWTPHPSHVTPENDRGTLAYLLNWYLSHERH